MLGYLVKTRRYIALLLLFLWAGTSLIGLILGWQHLFPALGSVALCIGFGVFLTDRYLMAEQRRLWDSQAETQIRMIWRFVLRLRHPDRAAPNRQDPLSLNDLESRISDSFEGLLASKHAEEALETYRIEMIFSILGTLQWGFGGMLIGWLHG